MNNELLWGKFIKGDKDALAALFNSVYDDLYSYGLRLSKNSDLVNDSIQDLFLKLWKNKHNLSNIEIVRPYLLKALRRHLVANLQWNTRFTTKENISEDEFEMEYSHEDFITREQEQKETTEKLISLLNQLTPRQKEAIYLRYFKEIDIEEVAEIMNMNVQSVRNTLHRGVISLREFFPFLITLLKVSSLCR